MPQEATETILRPDVGEWDRLVKSFDLALKAARRKERTRVAYGEALRAFKAFCLTRGMPLRVGALSSEHVREYLAWEGERHSANTVNNRYRGLLSFFRWAQNEGEARDNPLDVIRRQGLIPKPEVKIVQPLTDWELQALLRAAAKDKSLTGLRDSAILWLLLDTGMRRGELLGLRREDVDLDAETVFIREGKGGRQRVVRIGARAQVGLDRYLRRRRDPLPELWIGRGGKPLAPTGLHKALTRVATAAGIRRKVHAHMFRHTAATRLLANNESTSNTEILMGWVPGSAMLRRYTAATESARARTAHKTSSPADTLPWSGRL